MFFKFVVEDCFMIEISKLKLFYLKLTYNFFFQIVDMMQIKVFVLDEADVMIDTQGFKDISFRIYESLPVTCQLLLFSATCDDSVMDFAKRVVQKPNIIKVCC